MPTASAGPVVENEKGRIEIIPGNDVQALSWGTWRFRWTLGFDVEPGGGMEVVLVPRFPTNRWSLPQTHDPTAPGYVSARADGDTIVTLDILRWPLLHKAHGATLHIIQVGVGGRRMRTGETIEVTYGDRRGGSLGTQVQPVAREVAFPVFVSRGRDPRFLERFALWNRAADVATLREKADFSPSLRVTGGRASSFNLVAPMEVSPGEPFAIRLSVLDSACNPATGYEGMVEIRTSNNESGHPSSAHIEGATSKIGDVTLSRLGFHRIYAVDPNRCILGVSNPIRVTENPAPIYWGDIHSHSELSDGIGTPDEHYSYAKDVALLDFASVCDHDRFLEDHPERWVMAARKAREYSTPGEFIAILSYEGRMRDRGVATAREQGRGDINVYYLLDREDMLQSFPVPLTPSIVQGKDVLLIPHSPLYGSPQTYMGTHWENLETIPTGIMPLVEIFSTHGNSEYYDCPLHVLWQARGQGVLDALKKGFRLGFIGSGDYHELLTGGLLRIQDTPRTVNNQHMQARGGLAAVQANRLTRSGIYQAMKARRTYATSGIRAYVGFSVNGNGMGQECSVPSPSEPRELKIAVAAPERIVKLEIVRNGEVIADLADGNWFVETTIIDEDPIPDGAFYYIRVTTERTDFAWSSPVWVDIAR